MRWCIGQRRESVERLVAVRACSTRWLLNDWQRSVTRALWRYCTSSSSTIDPTHHILTIPHAVPSLPDPLPVPANASGRLSVVDRLCSCRERMIPAVIDTRLIYVDIMILLRAIANIKMYNVAEVNMRQKHRFDPVKGSRRWHTENLVKLLLDIYTVCAAKFINVIASVHIQGGPKKVNHC